jgi:hypothetical protein
MRSSQNALVHGACTNAVREEMSKLKEFLRYCRNIANNIDQG